MKIKEKSEQKLLLKEYIIDLYKKLILNLNDYGIEKTLDEYIHLIEFVEVLSFEDLKECYLWQKKFTEKFKEYYRANFDEEDIIKNSLVSSKSKEFYKFFSAIMDFEIEKGKLLERIKNNDVKAKLELEKLYKWIRGVIKSKKFHPYVQIFKDKLHNLLLNMMNTTLKFEQIDGYKFESEFESGTQKYHEISSLYHDSINSQLEIEYNSFNSNEKKLQNLAQLNTPVIFAVNHTNSHDIPLACKVIKERASVLAGDEIRYDINGLLLTLNDVTWVTRHDAKSRWQSKYDICLKLFNGLSNIMFVEGTWNMTENKPMLPFNWGIIEIAQITECPIVPIVLEYTENSCIIKVGNPIKISIYDDKKKAIDNLRDTMSTMRWYIWEQKTLNDPQITKEHFYRHYVDKHLAEYPKLDVAYEESIIFKIEDTPDKVFEPINKLSKKNKIN